MLKIKELKVSYDKQLPNIISGLSLDVRPGTVLSVLGQNGVGKSTLLRCLTREIADYEGSVTVDGVEVGDYSIKEYAKKVGVVASHSITYQNLLVADYLMTGYANSFMPFERPGEQRLITIMGVLELFGKEELFNKQIDQLSSGERQLIMIARAIIQNPDIILLDEPMANLDVRNQLIVLEQICLLRKKGYTVVVTTHNPGHALTLGGDVLLMGKQQYLTGTVREIITEENLSKFYGLLVKVEKMENYESIVFFDDKDMGLKMIL